MVLICDLDGTISYASPAGLRLQLPAGGAGRQAAERVRPPGGHRGGAGCGPAGARLSPEELRPRRWRTRGEPGGRGRVTRRPLLLPGAGRGRHLAARRVRRAALPAARRARADAGERQGRQRPGRAAPAGDPPDLPRRADRPAEPRLRGGARAGGARRRRPSARPASSSSTSTASPRSTTWSGTARVTWCSPRRRGGCARSCPPRRPSPAGAATSSRCCSRTRRRPRRSSSSPSGWPASIAGEPFRVADREIGLTASVGVALADEQRARRGAAQRGRGHGAGQGQRRRPGRGLRRAHARGRGAPP